MICEFCGSNSVSETRCLNCGMNVRMIPPPFIPPIVKLVEKKKEVEKVIPKRSHKKKA